MMKYTKKDIKVQIRLSIGVSITGYINIVGYERLSDFINDDKVDDFFKVYDCTIDGLGGNDLLVNRNHVIHINLKYDKKGNSIEKDM